MAKRRGSRKGGSSSERKRGKIQNLVESTVEGGVDGEGGVNRPSKGAAPAGASKQEMRRRASNTAAASLSISLDLEHVEREVYLDSGTTRRTLEEITTQRESTRISWRDSRIAGQESWRRRAGHLNRPAAIVETSGTQLNPMCLEMYLDDKEFEQVFQMSKEAFYQMRQWKQRELKKKAGLF